MPQVCQVLWDKLQPIYMKAPADPDDWKLIAENFKVTWDFPHCIGALDGKHVVIQAPDRSGSQFFNYKGTFSIVLMALVDARYRFISVDVGAFGRNSDGGIFANSNLGRALNEERLNLPDPEPLDQAPDLGDMPYVIVGDEAFPLKPNLMRPFPVGKRQVTHEQLVFNYRLSRARRIVENAFGILASRWRIYRRTMNLAPNNANIVILSTCVLHNFLQTTSTPAAVPVLQAEDQAAAHLPGIDRFGHRAGGEAMAIRDKFARYFNTYAALPWQHDHVRRGLDG